jgi:hypothetical protein
MSMLRSYAVALSSLMHRRLLNGLRFSVSSTLQRSKLNSDSRTERGGCASELSPMFPASRMLSSDNPILSIVSMVIGRECFATIWRKLGPAKCRSYHFGDPGGRDNPATLISGPTTSSNRAAPII